MSGILAIFHRDRSPVGRVEVQPVATALAHRGPDGFRQAGRSELLLGHHHHWTTPEEVDERQPLAGGGCYLAFDGRLDNRRELLHRLGRRSAADSALSDAALLLLAWERWREGCFERLVGPFAALIFDRLGRRLLCARDPLGGRTLFHHLDSRRLVVASEEHAVLAHPLVDDEPDRRRLVEHLALRVPADGRTFWRHVRELRPGHLLIVEEQTCDERRFDEVRPAPGLARLSEAESAERLRELLERGVARRLRAPGPAAVLMSGGLDSTALAALAGRRARAAGAPPATPISWVFDELAECDERHSILPVCRRLGTPPVLICGDDAWPLRQPEGWVANPGAPEESPYRLLKQAAYRAASERGGRVLLTGGFGDQLWAGASWWLAGLVSAGRPVLAATELLGELATRPQRAFGGVRRALGLPALRRAAPPAWLTAAARRAITDEPGRGAADSRLLVAVHSVLGAHAARSATAEIFHASHAGIELRHPYRDREVVEFALGLPAERLYRRGRKKHLLRAALEGLLPETLLAQRSPFGGLESLYRRGVGERELATARKLLTSGAASWRGIIEPGWLTAAAPGARSGSEELALWHCLTLALWHRRHRAARDEPQRRVA